MSYQDSSRSPQENIKEESLLEKVAAIFRDETIYEVKRDHDELLAQLRVTRTVQVTGPNGIPIYAQGQLDDGQFQRNRNLWGVNMVERCSPCLLSSLNTVELRFGGKVVAAFEGYSTEFSILTNPDHIHVSEGGQKMEPPEEKEDANETVNICFTPNTIWMQVDIGWKRNELIELGFTSFEDGQVERVRPELLSGFLPEEDPGRICNFLSIITPVEFLKNIIPHALDPAQMKKNYTFNRVYEVLKDHVDNDQRRQDYTNMITSNDTQLEDISDDETFKEIVLDYVSHLKDTFNRVYDCLGDHVDNDQRRQDFTNMISYEIGFDEISDDETFEDTVLDYIHS